MKNIMAVIWFSFFVLLLIVLAWGYQLWKTRRIRRMIASLPGPAPLPFLGNALEFLDIMNGIFSLPKRYLSPFRVWMGNTAVIITINPADAQFLLVNSKAFTKYEVYDYLKPLMGNGLFTATVPVWKQHRKIIMPIFSQKMLNSFVEIFAQQAEVLTDQLKKKVGQEPFDVFRYTSAFSIDSICETTMGVKVNAQIEESPFLEWVTRATEIAFQRMFHVWMGIDIIFKMTPYASRQKEVIEKAHRFVDKIIKERKEEYLKQQKEQDYEVIDLDEGPKWRSILDRMIEWSNNGNNLTDEELRDEVYTIIMAGSDTTASTIGFALIMLAIHPEYQSKVYEEVMDILGADRTLEYPDLRRLVYTERVLKETLRLYPAGPLVARTAEEDIRMGNTTIPADSVFVISMIAMHRNPDLFPDPLKFNPDRFLPEEVAKRHSYSWIPFAAGPRNCIGLNYAMMQMKTAMAYLIRRYRIDTDYKSIESIKLKADLVIKPENGHTISIESRE